MTDLGDSLPQNYHAYAHGAARPVASGCTGPSASGWLVVLASTGQEIEHKVVQSRSANRLAREAGIMAVLGVVESPDVADGSNVHVWLNNEELVGAVNAGFIRANGKPMAGVAWWSLLIECTAKKRINLRAFLADSADLPMNLLVEEVSAAAKEKLDEMGAEEAQRLAKDLTKTPRFP